MEWKVSDLEDIFSIDLNEKDGLITVSSLKINGEKAEPPKIRISKLEDKSRISVEIDGNPRFAHVSKVGDKWWIHLDGEIYIISELEKGAKSLSKAEGGLSAPMPGTVLDVMVTVGQRVREGQPLMTMEAMKMEHRIVAPKAGEVISIYFNQGDRVDMGSILVELGD
jgi:3-methylcrotonyl-CoA carboxylase alpha subunit